MNLSIIPVRGDVIIIAIILITILLLHILADYGRKTALGYWGTLILSLFASPVVAFIVVLFLKRSPTKG